MSRSQPPNHAADPLDCPVCGMLLSARLIANGSPPMVYLCFQHGRFWRDDEGKLHKERRATDRVRA